MQSMFLSFDMNLLCQYKQIVDDKVLTINVNDAVLLDYIVRAFPSKTLQHIKEDGISYVWLQHDHIIEDLPILNIAKPRLKQMLSKLKDLGLIITKNYANKKAKGSRAYYAITKKCVDLIYNEKLKEFYMNEVSKYKDFNVKDSASEKSYTSNSILTNNSILDNSKELYKNIGKDCTQLNNNTFLGSNKKSKKLSRFDKIETLILNFTGNEKLRTYIRLYFSNCTEIQRNSGKDFYEGMAKGALTRLSELSSDVNTQIKIVAQSVELGYKGLYMPKDENRKYNNSRTYKKSNPAKTDCGLAVKETTENIKRNQKFWKELEESGQSSVF